MGTFANIGIKQIALCDKGTLLTTPTNPVVIGTRNNEELTISDLTNDDVKGRPLIYKRRFETPVIENRQPNLQNLQDLLFTYRAVQGCDAEILCEPQTSGVDGGCFQFTGSNYIGYKTTYEMSAEKRILGIQLGVSLNPLTAKALVDAADANTPASFSVSNYGIDHTKERFPFLDYTAGTFNQEEIIDYSLVLEEVGEENKLDGRFHQDYIQATLMFKFRSATIANIVADMNESAGVSISFKQKVDDTAFERFVFNQYVLRKKSEYKISDKERYIMQTYVGKFPRTALSFSFTTANGGGSTQDGTEGGTVTISL